MSQLSNRAFSLPWMTLLLVGVLIGSLWLTQNWREDKLHHAMGHYTSSGLFEEESAYYIAFHSRNARLEQQTSAGSVSYLEHVFNGSEAEQYAWLIFYDRTFSEYMQSDSKRFIEPDVYQAWQEKHTRFNTLFRNELPEFKYGLVPQEARPFNFLSYLFVEFRWQKAALNLFLILLCVPFIEARFGRSAVPLWFVVGGGVNAVLYYAYSGINEQIITGYAGASAGMIGVLASIIAQSHPPQDQFNKRAWQLIPTLMVILGLKIATEYQLGLSSPHEIGSELGTFGICAALCTLLFSNYLSESSDKQSAPKNRTHRSGLQEVYQALSRFEFEDARSKLQSLAKDDPEDITVARQSYQLEKLCGSEKARLEKTEHLIDLLLQKDHYDGARALLRDLNKMHRQQRADEKALPMGLGKLMRLFVQHNDLKKAEHCMQLMADSPLSHADVEEAKSLLSQEYRKRGQMEKASEFAF